MAKKKKNKDDQMHQFIALSGLLLMLSFFIISTLLS